MEVVIVSKPGMPAVRGRVQIPPFGSAQDWDDQTLGIGKEESELRFEVNGQMFFVNFIPEEGRWYCFAPTATGVQRIPVSMDASPFEAFTVAVDEQEKEVVN